MKTDTLKQIAEEIRVCQKCSLFENRTNAVPGYGDPNSDIMFIGEGPGENEDKQGLPFVGAAGKYLDKLLEMIKMDRERVFIANVIKCRAPGNRDPLPDEVAICWPYLERQIKVIKPKLIVTLGRHSMMRFIKSDTISKIHGQPKRINGQVYFPIYHPAAALYRGSLREDIEKDFKKIPKVLEKIDESGGKGISDDVFPKQKGPKQKRYSSTLPEDPVMVRKIKPQREQKIAESCYFYL